MLRTHLYDLGVMLEKTFLVQQAEMKLRPLLRNGFFDPLGVVFFLQINFLFAGFLGLP